MTTTNPPEDDRPTEPLTAPATEPTGVTEPTEPLAPPVAEPAPAAPPSPVYSTRVRPMTVVWGAVLLLIGATLVAWAFGARFDPLIGGSVILAAAGLALIVSAVGSSVRRARKRD